MIHLAITRHASSWLAALILAGSLSACGKDPATVQGFVLPEGDVGRGQEVFAAVGCRYCHTIIDVEFEPFEQDQVLDIELGGKVYKVKTYGELLTSIVNPTHIVSPEYRATLEADEKKDAQSPMPEFNDVINVTQLIDLTAFLHSRYELLSPQYRGYYYGP